MRTGCGKSAVARFLSRRLRDRGKRVAVLRHPMPYGDLAAERVQRFASAADLDAAHCTIEEREEYEPHIAAGNVVFAGVDYAAILKAAEQECDIILWDGGNNDFPFIRPDLHIALADALRPRQLATHHPGEAVLRMADILVVTKVDAAASADTADRHRWLASASTRRRPIVRSASPVRLDDAAAVKGRRVLVIEDGPTITHGGMPYGAGYVAAIAAGAARDRRSKTGGHNAKSARPSSAYPHIGRVLPALGYGEAELEALADTIAAALRTIVVSATPIDLARLIPIAKPLVRARYEYAELGDRASRRLVDGFVAAGATGRDACASSWRLGAMRCCGAGKPPDAESSAATFAARRAAVAPIAREHDVVITHGNGPQIGLLALQAAAYQGAQSDRSICWVPRPRG